MQFQKEVLLNANLFKGCLWILTALAKLGLSKQSLYMYCSLILQPFYTLESKNSKKKNSKTTYLLLQLHVYFMINNISRDSVHICIAYRSFWFQIFFNCLLVLFLFYVFWFIFLQILRQQPAVMYQYLLKPHFLAFWKWFYTKIKKFQT